MFSSSILLQILACAIYGNWWPMLSALMYVLVPMPCMFFGGGSTQFLSSSDGGGTLISHVSSVENSLSLSETHSLSLSLKFYSRKSSWELPSLSCILSLSQLLEFGERERERRGYYSLDGSHSFLLSTSSNVWCWLT
ncbi:vacuolar protein sorting-associated protein 55 isoform X2 [Amborella trichopoda]|uniref:vacuolar protein sorting-associated protein 55 isoform X2 n=1 Tax=Amborella trichopoda TaxID=13333 RepID=UPI0009BE4BF3|nr:vacuolar protein sorting-associated protein 55 isoform X2 [Amborella trichopoda]|eukprot:XP_020527358.1 vacuolar protein sorting-associated protein 55 isoform X2 [Amborella trichopoda]